MISLLASTPRETGAGTYVAHLARGFPGETEVFFRHRLSPEEYERTTALERSGLDAAAYLRAKLLLRGDAGQTHVTSEGFGPLFGHRTALVTVHQVLDARAAPPNDLSARVRYLALRRAYRGLVRFGTPVVADSEATREALVHGWGADPGRVVAIPNAVDTERFFPGDRDAARRRRAIPSGAFVILHVGSDDRRKNVAGVLATWGVVRARVPRAYLVHVGQSVTFERFLQTTGDARVRYRPRVSSEELLDWYRSADVLFHPTRLEGFGYPVFESMACGTPALVSDLEAFREELGPLLWARDADDIAGFARELTDFAAGGRTRGASELRQWVASRYSLPTFVSRFRRLYRSLGLRS